MKKLAKFLLPLMLVTVALFSLTACGDDITKHDIALGQSATIEGYKITVDSEFTPITEKTLDYWTANSGNTYFCVFVKVEASEALIAPYTRYVDAETGKSNIIIQLEYKGTVCYVETMPSKLLHSVYEYGDDSIHTMEANREYNFPFVFEIPEGDVDASKALIFVKTATDEYRFAVSA